jgi:hypothetical protein
MRAREAIESNTDHALPYVPANSTRTSASYYSITFPKFILMHMHIFTFSSLRNIKLFFLFVAKQIYLSPVQYLLSVVQVQPSESISIC